MATSYQSRMIIVACVLLCTQVLIRFHAKSNSLLAISYRLKNGAGDEIASLTWEVPEQLMMYHLLDKSDSVLNLGGNAGGSCITAARLGCSVSCVEPVPAMQAINAANSESNHVHYSLVRGVVDLSGQQCAEKFRIATSRTKGDQGLGTRLEIVPKTDADNRRDVEGFIDVPCTPLQSLPGWPFSVLFADCEGCLVLNASNLQGVRAVFLEEDGDYRNLHATLEDAGFILYRDFSMYLVALRTRSLGIWGFRVDMVLQFFGGFQWILHSVCSWIATYVALRLIFEKTEHTHTVFMVLCQVMVACFAVVTSMGDPSVYKFMSGSLICPLVFNVVLCPRLRLRLALATVSVLGFWTSAVFLLVPKTTQCVFHHLAAILRGANADRCVDSVGVTLPSAESEYHVCLLLVGVTLAHISSMAFFICRHHSRCKWKTLIDVAVERCEHNAKSRHVA
eukprot:TRINITY_DN58012_c0_g1_i1.p1 TRINITY_DN58012_c0_g1~~TRINITY_DN58012_c0_g1_i1.p1  ORF type:complete len:450 (-),score=25.40 TRINITY_DN58012_c0_g1_i1:128-1477(-)